MSNEPVDITRPSALRELLANAGPTVATMTSYTVMQFVDMWMVSRIGPDPIYVGAQGNGGLAAWVPVSVVMGFLTIVNTYVSQNLGSGRPERGVPYVWNALWISLLASVLLIPYGFALPHIFALMGHTPERVAMQTVYAQPLIFGAFLTMATRAVAQFFYGLHRPGVVLVAGLVGNLVNFGLNWVLIYGNLGAPKLGIVGAAYATVIGTAVELAIPLVLFLGPMHRQYNTRSAWRLCKTHLGDLLRLGWPGAAMFGNEMICWSIFMVALVGQFGEVHSTAGWIAHRYMSLSFMPTVGLAVAITAVVGRCMGAGRPDLAEARANLGLKIAVVYMTACGVLFVTLRRPLVELFLPPDLPPQERDLVIELGSKFLIATAAFQFFDGVAMSLTGALRGAGDTRWPGLVTILLSWIVIVGGGLYMVRFHPEVSSLGPWIAAAAYIACLGCAIGWRYKSGAWKSIRLLESPQSTEKPQQESNEKV